MDPARRIAVTHAGMTLTGVVTTMLGAMLPALAAAWALSDSDAGRLFFAQFAGGFCGALLSTRLIPRYGAPAVFAAALGCMTAGVALAALASRQSILLCVPVYGLGVGLINPSANLVVSRANPRHPAAALNLLNFSWGIGAVAAPLLIAFLLRRQPPGGVFAVLAAAAAVMTCAALMTSGNSPHGPARSAPAVPSDSGIPPPVLPLTGLLLFLYVAAEAGISGWLPSLTLRTFAVSPATAAASQSVFWGAILSGRFLAPLWLKRISPHRLITGGLALAAAGIGLFLTAHTLGVLFLGVALSGAGLAAVFPTTVATFTTRLGAAAGRTAGSIFACGALGGALGPWAVGQISTHFQSLHAGLMLPLACIGALLFVQFRLHTAHQG